MSKPNLLLNENIGIKVAGFLKKKNYNLKSSIENFRGIDDKELLTIANKENRVIVTLDKDFAHFVFRDRLPCCGIILLRLRDESPKSINKVLSAFLKNSKQNLNNKFVFLTENRARIRPLPNNF